jgi:hypothetical protein
MEKQVLAIIETTRTSEETPTRLRVVVAKKDLDDNKAAIAAIGYGGGGCWHEHCAVVQLDEFQESVESIIEIVSFFDDSEEYTQEYEQLLQDIYEFCYTDEEGVPHLKEEYFDGPYMDKNKEMFDHFWDWDSEILPAISQSSDWTIFYSWKLVD